MAKTTSITADETDAGEDVSPKAKRSKLRLAMFAAIPLLLIGGASAGGYFYFFKAKPEDKAAAPAPKPAVFFDVPEVMVNLASTGTERSQYLKVKIVLELPDAALVQQITPLMPRVMDTFQVFLREMRPTDLEGSAGLFRLKEELTRRVNLAIAPGRINAVLFKEFIVQ
jgi:flagellar FliL protein